MTHIDRSQLPTEQRNPASERLDTMTPLEIVDLLHEQNLQAVEAVRGQREQIAAAIELVAATFRRGGRLFYVGAGTSGRLGVLDAAECPPTFGVPPWMVQGIISGGYEALYRSKERAEDNADAGAAEIKHAGVDGDDVVMGIAASGTTPFVCGAMVEARRRGARTIFLTCNPPHLLTLEVDLVIAPVTGPEIVTGSTRLKAGTATKLVLNAITTGAMVRIGKVYGNLMVDLQRTCSKLEDRAVRIVCAATGCTPEEADALLTEAGGKAKTAICMRLCGEGREEAERRLAAHGGNLRAAVQQGG